MKQETYLTYFTDAGEQSPITLLHADELSAFKEAHKVAAADIGRVVLVFKQIEAFSAEVVVRPVKSVPVAPVKPRKPRSDKGTRKRNTGVIIPDTATVASTFPAAPGDDDKPLFDYDPKTIKKK